MYLVDYAQKVREETNEFYYWWNMKRRASPEDYPVDMDKAEWDEQFSLYRESIEEESNV